MSFTDRYIKVPIKIYDIKHEELTGEKITHDSYWKIHPFEISRYRPCKDDDLDAVRVTFKDGESYLVYMHVTDFELLLNNHTKNA